MQAGWCLIEVTTIAGPKGLADDERSIHDNPEVSVTPAQPDVGKCVFGWNLGILCEVTGDALHPGLYPLLVKLDKLFGAW